MKTIKYSKSSNSRSKLNIKLIIPITILLGLAVVVAIILSSKKTDNVAVVNSPSSVYSDQVDDETGAPRDGRDPASQQQSSLAAAASNPTGSGQRIENPEARTQVESSGAGVNDSPSEAALGANGCFVDYGIQGEQCVPSHAAVNGTLTCEGVKTHGGFPDGVKVSGTDRFNLDTNHDGVACGSGD